MQRIEIFGSSAYPVFVGHGLLGRVGALARLHHEPCALALIMDKTVEALYGGKVEAAFLQAGFLVHRYRFLPGEQAKSFTRLFDLLEFLSEAKLGRHDLIAALGGGVCGDLAGFAAAIYQRGTAYVQIPTTLLAAADSSIGGKTAINLRGGKNLAGAFWQPKLVVCDCGTFDTLPQTELASGTAECVKYAMLGDEGLLHTLANNGLDAPWARLLPGCIKQKADIVALDEREGGDRQLLNFGHTLGHAIEKLSRYEVGHGQAVAIGMWVFTRAAERMGLCAPGTSERLSAALSALKLPMRCPYSPSELAQATLGDKKRRGERMTLVLPRTVGQCFLHTVSTDELEALIGLGTEG